MKNQKQKASLEFLINNCKNKTKNNKKKNKRKKTHTDEKSLRCFGFSCHHRQCYHAP